MNQQHNARRTQSRSSDGNEAGAASEMPMQPGGESMGGARGGVLLLRSGSPQARGAGWRAPGA